MIKVIPNFKINDLNLMRSQKNTLNGIRKGFYFAGKSLTKESIKLINSPPKTGRIYMVKVGIGGKQLKNIRSHRSSAAGQAPAVITGKLRKSINFKVHNSNQLTFGSEIDYGADLENGTFKMSPRPYLKPAIKNQNKNTALYLRNNILKSINSA